ncbi:Transcriptional regulatory protein ASH1 [Zancudomyces culisetae]|uniref:Transcriptional regulatory protein ASH1 n=1 Tax=Zancudomyces culisetae TaxID=1213189 RepID=A0A1R1PYC8_ZANCU|nr:Transcriptional regulatory protein ASH1 [Zancudomyces culisetae]|eukprot:OMH85961.1 Transcriptional regulatory protein ASH1 [Zancudomyces culisetae]
MDSYSLHSVKNRRKSIPVRSPIKSEVFKMPGVVLTFPSLVSAVRDTIHRDYGFDRDREESTEGDNKTHYQKYKSGIAMPENPYLHETYPFGLGNPNTFDYKLEGLFTDRAFKFGDTPKEHTHKPAESFEIGKNSVSKIGKKVKKSKKSKKFGNNFSSPVRYTIPYISHDEDHFMTEHKTGTGRYSLSIGECSDHGSDKRSLCVDVVNSSPPTVAIDDISTSPVSVETEFFRRGFAAKGYGFENYGGINPQGNNSYLEPVLSTHKNEHYKDLKTIQRPQFRADLMHPNANKRPFEGLPEAGVEKPKRKIKRTKRPSSSQRVCASCKVNSTPCWRPGWTNTISLCNSCGLRYKKGRIFCKNCSYVPMKTEITSGGVIECKSCKGMIDTTV